MIPLCIVPIVALSGCGVDNATELERQELGIPSAETIVATETFDPLNYFGGGVIGSVDFAAEVHCPGTVPSGSGTCPSGSRTELRGFVSTGRFVSADSRMMGWVTTDMNASFDSQGAGQLWGKYTLVLDVGGTWEGTLHGSRSVGSPANCMGSPFCWVTLFKGVGFGSGGSVEGMHSQFIDDVVVFPVPPLFALRGHVVAQIFAPQP